MRNKFVQPGKPYGETDPNRLAKLEEFHAKSRIAELVNRPIKGRFDHQHMKTIHQHIFQDVYDWAGRERTAPVGEFMTKMGPDVVNYRIGDPAAPRVSYHYYPAGPALTEVAETQYHKLAEKNLLRGLSAEVFATQMAEIWGELNVIHSFREGDTRAQFVFFSQLAEQDGWLLQPEQFAPGSPHCDDFVAARFYSQATGNNRWLSEVLLRAIIPLS